MLLQIRKNSLICFEHGFKVYCLGKYFNGTLAAHVFVSIDKTAIAKDILGMRKLILLAILSLMLYSSCVLLKAGDLASEAFMREGDPALAAAAMPTMIKAAEALLLANPNKESTALTTASLYVMYANAFLEGEAFLLPDEAYEEKLILSRRATSLYIRAAALLIPFIERRAPSAFNRIDATDSNADPLSRFGRKDVPLLYWSASAILAAFAGDPMNFDNAAKASGALALFEKARSLDPDWNGGSLHELAITVYGSLPSDLGGNHEEAEEAFATALISSGSSSPGAYVAYATSVCVARGDRDAFKASLEAALKLEDRPASALMDALARRKAMRLLGDIDFYFM